jgi:hypothetical protein
MLPRTPDSSHKEQSTHISSSNSPLLKLPARRLTGAAGLLAPGAGKYELPFQKASEGSGSSNCDARHQSVGSSARMQNVRVGKKAYVVYLFPSFSSQAHPS